jgi:aminopeptidase N/puromycin-sensitive aminopeptidase
VLGDQWALVRTGTASIGEYLNLVVALKNDLNGLVLNSAFDKVRWIYGHLATDEDRAQLSAVVQREFGPVYGALGQPSAAESYDRQELRSELMGILGLAKQPAVLGEARQLADRAYASSERSGDPHPMLTDKAIAVAAASGDASFYDKVMAASRNPADPGAQSDALRTLALFQNPALVTRTLDYAVSGDVRNQDSWIPISMLLAGSATREQTWEYVQKNWNKVHAQLTTNSGAHIVNAAGNFCSAQAHDQVANFFATHKVDAAERTLAKALDNINDCVHLSATQEPALHRWLASQAKP